MACSVFAELRAIEAEACRRSFREFIRQAWDTVEPAMLYIDNWHIHAIADHLQAVTEGHVQKLLINVPPGHAKSLIVSVLWPAWVWTRNPMWRGLFSAYSRGPALRDSVKCRDLLRSLWYQETFEPAWNLKFDQNLKSYFSNTESGFRMALSTTGEGTSYRGDAVIVDDPINARDQHSEVVLERTTFWWDHAMSSRLNDKRKGAHIIIMQRLHERDLSGHVLEKGGYVHLCLPTEFEPDRRCRTIVLFGDSGQPFEDPRTEAGELLFPALFPRDVVDKIKTKELGSFGYNGQHQQRPAPAGGGIVQDHWWRYWQPAGSNLGAVVVKQPDGTLKPITPITRPESFEIELQSWDMAFKDLSTSDYVVGQHWGKTGADCFLLHQVRDRLNFPKTVDAVRDMTTRCPKAMTKLVEEKANGAAVLQTLQHEISGLIGIEPEGGKIARAAAVSPAVEAGNVYLPHPAIASWVDGFRAEWIAFPNGANDDQVDAASQALNRLTKAGLLGLVEFMKREQQRMNEQQLEKLQSNGGLAKPATGDDTLRCTSCGSVAIARLGGMFRCGQCGHQWRTDEPLKPAQPSRNDFQK